MAYNKKKVRERAFKIMKAQLNIHKNDGNTTKIQDDKRWLERQNKKHPELH